MQCCTAQILQPAPRCLSVTIVCTCCKGDAKASGSGAKLGKSAATAAVKAAYKLPADFDAAVLGQADLSSKQAAEKSLPQLFLQRWLDLHGQVTQPMCTMAPPIRCTAATDREDCVAHTAGNGTRQTDGYKKFPTVDFGSGGQTRMHRCCLATFELAAADTWPAVTLLVHIAKPSTILLAGGVQRTRAIVPLSNT